MQRSIIWYFNHWISLNKDELTFLSALALVVFTARYVVLTNRILRQSNRPYLHVSLDQWTPKIMRLTIRNGGSRRARDIKFTLSEETNLSVKRLDDSRPLGETQPFNSGISGLSPSEERTYLITFDPNIWQEDGKNTFLKFEMQYGHDGKAYTETFNSCLNDYKTALLNEIVDPILQISKSVKELIPPIVAMSQSMGALKDYTEMARPDDLSTSSDS